MTKELAKLIIVAQASSDVGKGKRNLYYTLLPSLQKRADYGYPEKDICILNALNILARHPMRDVHFFVEKDHNKVAKLIVYFDFMLNGQKIQISFHTYNDNVRRFFTGSKKSHTEWKRGLMSREMAFLLAKEYGFLKNPLRWETDLETIRADFY